MKKNYISQFYSGFLCMLFCFLPLSGFSAEANALNSVNMDYNSSYSLNFLSGISANSVLSYFNNTTANFGPRLENGSFIQATSNNTFFGCSDIVMPTLRIEGNSIVASGMPYGYGDQVQFLWAENVNGRIEARTSWTTDPAELTFYPSSAGNYRLCALKVGCSERSMRETPDIHYDAPCGTLTGVYIYDQTTDTRAYGPIVDGENITITDLPTNYYIVAETSGNIGSVNLTVNGESKLETIVPYTFPGGAQDGYNWNGGLGEHHVTVSAYKGNNTYSELCGTITLNFEIVVECNLTVDADDEEICEGEEVTLTANASGEATCETCEDYGSYPVGTKIYKVSDSDPTCSIFDGSGAGIIFQCNNSNHYDVWKAGNDLYYLEFPNQTAKIIGTVYRGNYTGELEIDYYDFKENASSNWTARCYENNLGEFDNYHYNGTLKVNGGNTYSIYNSGDSAYANIGYGTSNDGNGYGIGAWPRGSIGNCSEMFGNFDLVCEVAEEQSEIQYLWSNGETTQSITVSPDETTTYTVTVKDCADCEAEKDVTVTVNEIPEVTVDDIDICEGETGTLTATGTDGVTYLWNTGDDTTSIEVTEAGDYTVTVTTADGCEAMATATVTVNDPRSGTMTADATPICLDADSVQISATYNGDGNVPDGYVQLFVLTAGDDLVISGLDANPVFSISEAGKYTIHSLVVPEGF
ncbi:hypothetical protein HCU67_07870, partial [Muricauda sp. DJ-13]|nr:hypothetical protein [Croceivirga thetidis]